MTDEPPIAELLIDCSEIEPAAPSLAPLALAKSLHSAAVLRERERRLASGFDFDFGEQGVHRLATTEADMKGWDEVTKAATAAMLTGLPDHPLAIVTETGPVSTTASEWQHVLLAATAFRQPIWAASFTLQAAIDAALDRDALGAIDLAGAWPTT